MADDSKMPRTIPGQTSVTPQTDAAHMPRKSWIGSRLDELENRAALRAEIVLRERWQNNARYIEARSESALAQGRLDNIETEKEQIQEQMEDEHETRMANSKAERQRSLAEAGTLISEFAEKEAGHNAGKVEAQLREKRAQAELDALQAKLDGAPEQIEELKAELQKMTEEEIELSDMIQSLMGPENDGDETARGQLRRVRAALRNIEEEISSLKRYLKSLRGY